MTIHTNNRDESGYLLRPDSRRKVRNSIVHLCKRTLLGGISLAMKIPAAWLLLQRLTRAFPALSSAQFQPQRILVIRLDLIGDLVMSLVAVQALKKTYPQAEIDVVATPASAKVVNGHPDIHEVIAYDPNIWRRPKALLQRQNWRDVKLLRQRLRSQQYDLAICVHGTWSGIMGVLSGAPRRVGFAKENYAGFLTDVVPGGHWQPGDHIHEVDYCLQLAHAAGAAIHAEDRVAHLTVGQQPLQEVEALLQQEGVSNDRPLIACHVCSNNGQSKRWPLPYWARLIDRLVGENIAEVVLTGAPDDVPFIAEVLKRTHVKTINLAGKTSLLQLAALLQRADVMITGDSGPMHIGAAVGTPLIAIHGPTDPAQSGPMSPHATVVQDTIWCSPCYTAQGPADCRFFTTQCMKNISPERIFTIVLEKLSEKQATVIE